MRPPARGGVISSLRLWLTCALTGSLPLRAAAGDRAEAATVDDSVVAALRARVSELEAERDAWRHLAAVEAQVAGREVPELPASSPYAGGSLGAGSGTPAPTPEADFVGCKFGGDWVRPFGDSSLAAESLGKCFARCGRAGYAYAGFECPMRQRSRVHCQCSSDAEINRGSGRCRFAFGHCDGESLVDGYDTGGYAVGSVYRLRKVAAAAPSDGDDDLGGPELSSGGRIFVLTAFSHDDLDQWPLIPHWFKHYRDTMGLDTRHFLMILHSDSRNSSGVARMASWLREEYGVRHAYANLEPYTSLQHWQLKMRILHEHVSDVDWVMQVDNDEFVLFPQGWPLHYLLEKLDQKGFNVHYGVLVDRLPDDGDIDIPVTSEPDLFEQYPESCAITQILQNSDIRKATIYRGYLRSTTGNHNIILNQMDFNLTAKRWAMHDAGIARILEETSEYFAWYAPGIFALLPFARRRAVPEVKPAEAIASVFHFKWIRGLRAKIFRRQQTEEYTAWQYAKLRDYLDAGHRLKEYDMEALCRLRRGSSATGYATRPLMARELIDLIFNAKPASIDEMIEMAGVDRESENPYLHSVLQTLIQYSLLHEAMPS